MKGKEFLNYGISDSPLKRRTYDSRTPKSRSYEIVKVPNFPK